MAFFRTPVFTVRIGAQDLGVGPVSFLQVISGAINRAVDRRQASGRATEVNSLKRGLSFERSVIALPTYCLALMQNLSDEGRETPGTVVVVSETGGRIGWGQARILGVCLLNAVGLVALQSAITSLGDELRQPAPTPAA